MRRYVIRRLIQAVFILFLLSIGLFALIHAIPGGPDRVFLSPHQTEAARKAIIRMRRAIPTTTVVMTATRSSTTAST